MTRLLLATSLALAACASDTPQTVVSGDLPERPQVLPQAVERWDFSQTPPSTTTTTHYHPPTTTTVATLPAEPQPAPISNRVSGTGECGGWGDLISAKFPGEESTACRVFISCESGGNPNAVSSTNDHGLAQINETTWNKPGHHDPVADWIGRHWHSVYDPATNLEMARRIRAAYGWQMWSCY